MWASHQLSVVCLCVFCCLCRKRLSKLHSWLECTAAASNSSITCCADNAPSKNCQPLTHTRKWQPCTKLHNQLPNWMRSHRNCQDNARYYSPSEAPQNDCCCPNCCLHFRHWLVESELASDKFLPLWVWDGSCLLSTWPFKVLAWAPGLPLGAGAWNPPARMNRKVNHEKSPRKAACQMDASHELPGFYPAPCS